eukprot:CAMPEP_0181232272 /NCGR_PEP_ID=MMETSP1096-20121128/35630_1 /TAXON_ID=156174 ORGANISM="Chrysochromulina ericina, Strain CCMP281" /NCGR_SAMPLE_ID=MMETSP1096 /ASSEMBLY_ACC=CAM_ASM_000453 /LENGTH=52 /DNA_ID=CAMNT_0023326527 /DNA_START=495 /DNA_END=650 /DNA_ORIENTATION=-
MQLPQLTLLAIEDDGDAAHRERIDDALTGRIVARGLQGEDGAAHRMQHLEEE